MCIVHILDIKTRLNSKMLSIKIRRFMRKFIIGLLALCSISAFASLEMSIKSNDPEMIRQALLMDLQETSLNCIWADNGTNLSNQENKRVKDRIIGHLKAHINVKLSSDLEQPAIIIFYNPDSNVEEIWSFTTSIDFKQTITVEYKGIQTTTQEVNDGTLVSPIFRTVTTSTVVKNYLCSINH